MRWVHGLALALALEMASGCGDDDDTSSPSQDGAVEDASAGSSAPPPDAGPDAADSAPGPQEEPSADCDSGPIPTFDEVEILRHCVGCHATTLTGEARKDAPPNVNFDEYDSAVLMAERGALYVFHDVMPPPAAGITVTQAEKDQFYLWALCGTPR